MMRLVDRPGGREVSQEAFVMRKQILNNMRQVTTDTDFVAMFEQVDKRLTEMANPPGYAASKGGVIQLSRHLATVMAPDVRVNSITPGGVLRGQPESFHEQYVSRTPLKRMATEQDLKGAVVYLASDMSEYVTGHNLVVDGGWTAW